MSEEKRRILTVEIGRERDGKTVRDVMRGELLFSEKLMSRIKYRSDGIMLNGVRVRTTAVLREGDRLCLDITDPEESGSVWAEPPEKTELRVCYEDEDLLIVDKPSGMVCHPSFGHYADSLANHIAYRMGWTGTSREIHMIGRLDRDTCGLVVVAKNAGAAGLLARQREEGIMKKTYLALAEGLIRADAESPKNRTDMPDEAALAAPEGGAAGKCFRADGCIEGPIGNVPGVLMLRQVDPEGKPARTWYRILGHRDIMVGDRRDGTLLACRIDHGRTHQIRVHMASIGHPLAGDLLYGPGGAAEEFRRTGDPETVREINASAKPEESPLGLCAWNMELIQPFTKEKISVWAEKPEWAGDFDIGDIFQ
ncbi:MAG: RluA family pseudouridine synthase [[Clostridium] aminophilum]|uniref:RluA family pseudouridine synthase n=1 Tax=[Clostridium] aminophilum TaxID=1526 RepID=UPI0026ECC64F|nr:RluA family pseudouridine synthase [[Clostridium] aminophilum]MDD6195988.1 RluA family pseudouridine synthase [[Clostridium] aminophilum]